MQNFEELGLSKMLVKALTESGITEPTAIQANAIPKLIAGDCDFIGLAQTGTGKTAAFGLPLLELIDESKRVTQSLIIAPTRELAVQTANSLQTFAKYRKKIIIDVVYGGTPIMPHIRQLKSNVPMILVATPGRLIDLVDRKVINLENINYVVLDEADEILNMGFKEDIDKILSFTPEEKLTWLFSATMPAGIRKIVKQYMHSPAEVTVSKQEKVNKNITHHYVMVNKKDRKEALKRLMDSFPEFYGLVFCRTKNDTQELAEHLAEQSYNAGALHGDLSQRQRNETMKRFKSGILRILVATDVAARGIDVDNLTHVIHYALPDDMAFYTHRSGRTARAGKKGKSIVLLNPGQERKLDSMRKSLEIEISKMPIPSDEDLLDNKLSNWADKIKNADPTGVPEHMVNQCEELLTGIERKELLARLLSLEKINKGGKGHDLNIMEEFGRNGRKDKWKEKDSWNEKDSWRSRDKDKRKKKDKQGSFSGGRGLRFFINVGSMDRFDTGSLLKLICDRTDLSKKQVGNIDLGKRFSYFEIDEKSAGKVAKSFKNFNLKGRDIRVNRDSGGKK